MRTKLDFIETFEIDFVGTRKNEEGSLECELRYEKTIRWDGTYRSVGVLSEPATRTSPRPGPQRFLQQTSHLGQIVRLKE